MTHKLTKEQRELLTSVAHGVYSAGRTWYHFPYWIEKVEGTKDEYIFYDFDHIPAELKKAIEEARGILKVKEDKL